MTERRRPALALAIATAAILLALSSAARAGTLSPWWSDPVRIDPGRALDALSCPSARLCVATDASGSVLTTAMPAGGAGAWSATRVESGGGPGTVPLGPISCAPGVCVTDDWGGNLLVSTDPVGGAGAWTAVGAGLPFGQHAQVSCPSARLCVAVQGDEILTSTSPAGGAGAWSTGALPGAHDLTAVSCPATTLCVAIDDDGLAVTSTNPAGGAGTWRGTRLPPGPYNVWALSCPSTGFCAAVDHDSNVVLTSTDPQAGSWRASAPLIGALGGSLLDISCASASLCVASDDAGELLSSIAPSAGAAAWTASFVDGRPASPAAGVLDGISCGAPTLCVAVDSAGNALVSTDPGEPAIQAARPRLASARFSGLGHRKPKLGLTAAAGMPPGAAIARVRLAPPPGVRFTSALGVTVTGPARRRALRFSAALVRGALAIRLRSPARVVAVSISSLSVTGSIAAGARRPFAKRPRLRFAVTVGDTAGTSTPLGLVLRPRW